MAKGTNEKLQLLDEVYETKQNKSLIQKYKAFVTAAPIDSSGEELFCICRRPDDGELMVACDGCDEWFHFKCMDLDKKYDKLVNNFYCIFCDGLFDKGKTLWKRKCRLEGCMNPISTDPISKYCCRQHGEQFIKEMMLSRTSTGITKAEISKLASTVATYDEFLKLGTDLPMYDLDKLPKEISQKIDDLNSQIRAIDAELQNIHLQRAYLNNSVEKAKIINSEIFKLSLAEQGNNVDEELVGAVKKPSKNSKSTKIRRRDICGCHFGEYKNTTPITCLDDLEISEQEFASEYEKAKDGSEAVIFNTCIKDKSKCMKHSFWYEMKMDNLQNEVNQRDQLKDECRRKIKSLVAMGWDILENQQATSTLS